MDTFNFPNEDYSDQEHWRRQTAFVRTWDGLKPTEKQMFRHVMAAWAQRQTELGPEPGYLDDWVTRKEIAAQYGAERLIDYRLRLLDRLGMGKGKVRGLRWVEERKRTRWHLVDGILRPAGGEVVYLPNPEVIQALKDQHEGKISKTEPPPKRAPRPVQAADDDEEQERRVAAEIARYGSTWYQTLVVWPMDAFQAFAMLIQVIVEWFMERGTEGKIALMLLVLIGITFGVYFFLMVAGS